MATKSSSTSSRQLGIWMLYATMHPSGKFRLDDPEKMTAFADYIVPVALRLMGITSYSKELEHAINSYQLIRGIRAGKSRFARTASMPRRCCARK